MDLGNSLNANIDWNVQIAKAYVQCDIIYVNWKIYTAIL